METEIAVFGSINMDLVFSVDDFPEPGETIKGANFDLVPGGKGANQAVGVARLGEKATMYGMLGDGKFGRELKLNLQDESVNTDNVAIQDVMAGVASVLVNKSGENEIVVFPGANSRVDKNYVDEVINKINNSEFLLLQFEIPLETIDYLLHKIGSRGPKVILDPAPATSLPEDFPLNKIDFLTPNQKELSVLTQKYHSDEKGINDLLERGLRGLVIKKGSGGSQYISSTERFEARPFSVESRDSTAAGDAFNAALAVSLSRGNDIRTSLKFANAAGALTTTKRGAQPSLPLQQQVSQLFNS